MSSIPDTTPANAPYPGLRPYREDEQNNFFGRDADCKILIDKILVNRLTLLFAATGVGKSSLLQAAVLPQLKSPLGENLDVVYYIDWVSEPLNGLKQAVQQALQTSGSWRPEIVYAPKDDEKLVDFLGFCTLFTRQPLIVVLDQFEEFFRYQAGRSAFQPFLEQLTGVFSNANVPVHLVFSMREDFALELDAFKKYVPLSVFSNHYRLDKLGREAAQEAILKPLQPTGFAYEPELLEQLLKDLLKRELRRTTTSPLEDSTEVVEPPYLQIVCLQIWEYEQGNPEKMLRMKTYQTAGGAKGLLENYIFNTLRDFLEWEQVVTSHSLNHLIGQRGTKVAHSVPRLAELIHIKESELDQVLFKLEQKRILRSQPREGVLWYELYHDMFSTGLERWNTNKRKIIRIRKVILTGIATIVTFSGIALTMIWQINHANHYFRLHTSNDSRLEVYTGKYGWLDPFNQNQYKHEILLSRNELDGEKAFISKKIQHIEKQIEEALASLPIEKRIAAQIHTGLLDKKTQETNASAIKAIKENINKRTIKLNNKHILFEVGENNNAKQKNEARIAGIIGEKKFIPNLISNIENKTHIQESIKSLGLIGDDAANPIFNKLLFNERNDIRNITLESYGSLNTINIIPTLIKILQNPSENYEIRGNAAKIIGKHGNSENDNIEVLVSQLGNGEFNIRNKSADALGNIGTDHVIGKLIALTKNTNDPNALTSVAIAFSRIGSPHTRDVVTKLLTNPNQDVIISATKALGSIGNPKDAEKIISIYEKNVTLLKTDIDNDAKEKITKENSEMLYALGLIKHPEITKKLGELLENENELIRIFSLKRLSDENTIAPEIHSKLERYKNNHNTPNKKIKKEESDALLKLIAKTGTTQIIKDLIPNEREKIYALRKYLELTHPIVIESDNDDSSNSTNTEFTLNSDYFPSFINFSIISNNTQPIYTMDDYKAGVFKRIYGTTKDQRTLINALNLSNTSEKNTQLLEIIYNNKINYGIRVEAIKQLSILDKKTLTNQLKTLTDNESFQIKAAALKKMTDIENFSRNDANTIVNESLPLFQRLQALERLAKDEKLTAKNEILRIIKQEENELTSTAYRLLADIEIYDIESIRILENRLAHIDRIYQEWRKLRDSKSENPTDEDLKQIKEAKAKINPLAAFDYAYALSRLDPAIGKELLSHNLADVRQGAYAGIAMKANIQQLRALDQEREDRRDDPIFRHAAFRAIDMGLHRLEILGNNPKDGAKDKELTELRAWQAEIEKRKMPDDDLNDEVLERVQWTTMMMEYYNNLDAELREKYGMMRVWNEDTLPVNQPYPASH